MIYHLSMSRSGLWYLDVSLFNSLTIYQLLLRELLKQFIKIRLMNSKKNLTRSQEIFIQDHRNRFPGQDADAWKILEVASMGTLSKLYKNLQHQLPEKSIIAKEMGLNLHSELSSWLEAIAYVRNIIAHHSRLWSRNMVKKPTVNLRTMVYEIVGASTNSKAIFDNLLYDLSMQ